MSDTIVIEVDAKDAWRKLMRATNRFTGYEIRQFLSGDVAPYLSLRVRRRFAMEGDDASKKWAPLKAATWSFRRGIPGINEKHPINVRTRELFHHAQSFSTKAMATQAVLTMPGAAGTPRQQKKLKQAQRGNPARNSEPRPVLALERYPDAAIIEKLFVQFLKRGLL